MYLHYFPFIKTGLRIEGPSPARLEPKKNPDGTMDVAYYPTEPGEYAVHVLCNNEDIPKSPFMADIKPAQVVGGFDPSKVFPRNYFLPQEYCLVIK
jgi:filamin